MHIAVVNQGDSLWSIANRYRVPVDLLSSANELTPETSLVPGQSIVIPTTVRFARSYTNLDRSPVIEVNAYIRANDPNARKIVSKYAPFLTYFSVSSYRATASGEVTVINDSTILSAIEQTNTVPILVITNFTGEAFSPEITRELFTNESVRERFISSIIQMLVEKRYYAVNFDFEENYPEDRELYNEFLRIVTPRLKEQGVLVSTTLAPKISAAEPVAWFGGLDHDYKAHGEIVDFVTIMTYDIGGWFSGPPNAVSPLPTMRAVLDYGVSVIPSNKILLGLPLYGYDWKLPFNPETDFATTVGPREAINLARQKGAIIQYDTRVDAPFFTYFDEVGNEHVVWFEDARSMLEKLELIERYSLRGASYFILGRTFPENWTLLSEMFTIEKK